LTIAANPANPANPATKQQLRGRLLRPTVIR